MTQINLPNLSITGANLWSQVEDNDKAIRDVVNGNLDATNLANDAVTAEKLRDDASTDANRAVTTNHIRDGAITTAKIGDSQVTEAKIGDLQVTGAKLAAPTTTTVTYSNGASAGTPALTARKYADGLVVLEGNVTRVSASQNTTYANLPQGFRHGVAQGLQFVIFMESGGAGLATIGSSGNISFAWPGKSLSPSPFGFYLSGISFHAA